MKQITGIIISSVLALMLASCGTSNTATTQRPSKPKAQSGSTSAQKTPRPGQVTTGQASYYADKFHGRTTASGEVYDKRAMTCAHRTYPFGTMLKVTNTSNGKSVKVRVNDRGPFKEGRIVDLSSAAADKVDMKRAGVVPVKVEVLSVP